MISMDTGRITIHRLKVFLAVARRRSFTAAAGELHLSQSAVSAQIRELTDLLGVPLFEQIGRKIFLTDAGESLVASASRVEGMIDEIGREFAALRDGEAGSVRVGGSTSIGTYFLPSLIAAFSKRHPRIHVALEIENSSHIEERLLANDFDVGFVGGTVASGDMEAEAFLDDEIFFACAPSHPLAGAPPVTKGRLTGETLFVREPGSATRRTMEEYCRGRGLEWGSAVQLGSVEAIKQAVMAGLGISYFSSLTVEHEVATGRLVRLKVKGISLRRTFFTVRHRQKKPTPAMEKFAVFAGQWRREPGRRGLRS